MRERRKEKQTKLHLPRVTSRPIESIPRKDLRAKEAKISTKIGELIWLGTNKRRTKKEEGDLPPFEVANWKKNSRPPPSPPLLFLLQLFFARLSSTRRWLDVDKRSRWPPPDRYKTVVIDLHGKQEVAKRTRLFQPSPSIEKSNVQIDAELSISNLVPLPFLLWAFHVKGGWRRRRRVIKKLAFADIESITVFRSRSVLTVFLLQLTLRDFLESFWPNSFFFFLFEGTLRSTRGIKELRIIVFGKFDC